MKEENVVVLETIAYTIIVAHLTTQLPAGLKKITDRQISQNASKYGLLIQFYEVVLFDKKDEYHI